MNRAAPGTSRGTERDYRFGAAPCGQLRAARRRRSRTRALGTQPARAGARIIAPRRDRRGDAAALARRAAFVIDDAGPALIVVRAQMKKVAPGGSRSISAAASNGAARTGTGSAPAAVAGRAAAAAGGEARPELADPHGHDRLAQQRRRRSPSRDIRRRGRAVTAARSRRARRSRRGRGADEEERGADFHGAGFRPSVRAFGKLPDEGCAHGLLADEIGSPTCSAGTTSSATAATEWDGVRNNAARLHLRAMKPGDEAFFYHSGREARWSASCASAARASPRARTANGSRSRWSRCGPSSARSRSAEIKAEPKLAEMALVRLSRLSVSPVREEEWQLIKDMAGLERSRHSSESWNPISSLPSQLRQRRFQLSLE